MNKKLLGIGAIVVTAVIIVAGMQFLPEKKQTQVVEKTYTLTQQDLSKTVKMDGVVKLSEEHSTFSNTGGLVKERFVSVGDKVKKGQVLLTLDTSDLNEKLAQAKYQLTVDQDAFEDAKSGANGTLAANVERTKASLERAQRDVTTQKELFASGAVSAQELDLTVSKLEAAQSEYVSAQEKLKNASLDSELKKLSEKIKVDLMNIENIKKDIDQSTIRATASGTVITYLDDKQAYLNPGTLIAVTGDLGKLTVEAKVSEYDISGITIGQKATITTLGNDNKVYEGTVQAMEPTGTTENDEVLIKTTLSLSNPDVLIKPNFTVSVAITLESKQAILVVPFELVTKDDNGQWTITKKTAAGNEKVVVSKGLETDLLIEVISNELKPGDVFIYPVTEDRQKDSGGLPPPQQNL